MKTFITLLIVASFMACGVSEKKQMTNPDLEKHNVPNDSEVSFHIEEVKEKKAFQSLSNTEIESLAEHSKIGNMIIHYEDSTFRMVTDEDFIENLFYLTNGLDWISSVSINYEVEDTYYIDPEINDTIAMKEIFLGKSFIVWTNDDESVDKGFVVAANVVDSIQLRYGITIGMSKEDFFSILFSNSYKYNFDEINIVKSANTPGDIEQTFSFKDHKLTEITQKTSADWSEPVYEKLKNKK